MNKEITNKTPRPQARNAHARKRTSRKRLNVLIACEESQAECEAFRELGHNAFSCDIQPCKPGGHPEWHIHDDVTPYLEGKLTFCTQDGRGHQILPQWDLIIAHPPCTYLCRLSSCQLYRDADGYAWIKNQKRAVNLERYNNMLAGRDFFFKCYNAKAKYVAVENPVPMAIAQLPRPSAYACPSWFGVKYTKKTCYWLRNLPPLFAEIDFNNPKSYVNSSRGKYRSRTFPALAKAIAKQWSEYIIEDMNKQNSTL